MLVDVKTVLLGFDGKPLRIENDQKSSDMTAGDIIMIALANVLIEKEDKDKIDIEKRRRYALSVRCAAANETNSELKLSTEETQFIIESVKLLNLQFLPHGAIMKILDPDFQI